MEITKNRFQITLTAKEWIIIYQSTKSEKIRRIISEAVAKEKIKRSNKKKLSKKAQKEKESRIKEDINTQLLLETKATKFRSDLIKNQTVSEVKFKAILKSLKIEYEFQKIFYIGKYFRVVDFYIPSKKFIFEIDGEYHDTPEQKIKDDARTRQLKDYCTSDIKKIFRFTNKEIKDIEYIRRKIQTIMESY